MSSFVNAETENERERALLVSVDTGEFDAEISLDELEELADTAGADVLGRVLQKRESPDKATCLGQGRLEELALLAQNTEADMSFSIAN